MLFVQKACGRCGMESPAVYVALGQTLRDLQKALSCAEHFVPQYLVCADHVSRWGVVSGVLAESGDNRDSLRVA